MNKIDLSGIWNARLSPLDGSPFSGSISLPGTTSFAGLGSENTKSEPGYLTDLHPFEGSVLYERDVILPEHHEALALLTLERTRISTVYWDGREIGSQNSLTTPHRYLLPGHDAGTHHLGIRVNNTGYPIPGGHMTSPDTQSNWNGITGEITITLADALFEDVQIFPESDRNRIRVKARTAGQESGTVDIQFFSSAAVQIPSSLNVQFFSSTDVQIASSAKAQIASPADLQNLSSADVGSASAVPLSAAYSVPFENGELDLYIQPETTLPLWDEYEPNLLYVSLSVGGAHQFIPFGMRSFRAEGRKLINNGREVYLRGTHDGLLFPQTGFAPTDLESWLHVMDIIKGYGLNHLRYHTSCPPEAAFLAADIKGVWMEPELPFWGTVREPGEPEFNQDEKDYLDQEALRILKTFGHHPSFVMLSMGNELWGSKNVLNERMHACRALDPDKLYISGSNNFQFAPDVLEEEDVFCGVRFGEHRLIRGSYAMCDAPLGIVQTTAPESVSTFDAAIDPYDSAANPVESPVDLSECAANPVDSPVDPSECAATPVDSSANPNDPATGSHEPAANPSDQEYMIQLGTEMKLVQGQVSGELVCQKPVLSHEVGQYGCYPDFDEEDHYRGPLRPRYLKLFRSRLESAGLWEDRRQFFRSAGLLAMDCYKREIETALRSRNLAGFQLLDIKDYTGQGVALVGALNGLMENKGLISPESWRHFCADTAALGLFDRFVFQSGEELSFGTGVFHNRPFNHPDEMTVQFVSAAGTQTRTLRQPDSSSGHFNKWGTVSFGQIKVTQCEKALVRLLLNSGELNEYPIWLLPNDPVEITAAGIRKGELFLPFVHDDTDGSSSPAASAPCIHIPDAAGKLPAEYCSDFWNYTMFSSISRSMKRPEPIGTMGLCVDTANPLLSGFPTDDYTTPVWYSILRLAHCEPLDPAIHPAVQMIDNIERCQRLGILYEKDGQVYLTARLWENPKDPAVQALARSLLQAMM